MDASNNIRWNPSITPRGNETPKAQFPPPAALQETPPASVGDQVSITTGGPVAEARPAEPQQTPFDHTLTANWTAPPTARESVPVSLLADDASGTLVGGNPFFAGQSTSGLGVLTMMDDVHFHEMGHSTPVSGVRAIDDNHSVGSFGDLSLVGPGNAARYLANPSEMYLGM